MKKRKLVPSRKARFAVRKPGPSARAQRILIIDNYDSFTYNLLQYLGELGAGTMVRRNDEVSVREITKSRPAGIIISPGPCTPNEAGISVELIRELSGKIPILGVCLGHQAIAAAFGGKVIRAPEIMHGKTSLIAHDSDGIFRGLPSPFTATRYHSLCVERRSLPEPLVISAWVEGRKKGIIMGIRHTEHPTEGVQFHPESILTPCGHQILQNFLDMARVFSV